MCQLTACRFLKPINVFLNSLPPSLLSWNVFTMCETHFFWRLPNCFKNLVLFSKLCKEIPIDPFQNSGVMK